MAYLDPRRGPREAVYVGARRFTSDLGAGTWSPDERTVRSSRADRGSAVLDPATGAVTDAGRVSCGDVYSAVWR